MNDLHLLSTIAVALCVALAGGMLARFARLPSLAGYLVAGLVISPFTPGYDAETESLAVMAEIGVIFLMFGVGLHFNVRDLLAVRNIALPGAIIQIAATALISMGAGALFGLSGREGLVLGLAISVASTVVLVRALEERRMLDSLHGRVAVGWLVIEDLATVLILVLLPALDPEGESNLFRTTAIALLKATAFLAVMLAIGARLVPWLLSLVVRFGSRELFILSVVSLALAIATGASTFGLSVAIGAFIAGVVISETDMSHQAAADVLPLREAFAVLFFVTVGMLLDPGVVVDNLGLVAVVSAIVLFGKALIALVVASLFPYPARTALTVAAGLAQVGEFSFIVAEEAMGHRLMTNETYNVILAVAVLSIAVNPLAFAAIRIAERLLQDFGPLWRLLDHQGAPPLAHTPRDQHVIIAGYGRVGELTGHALAQLDIPFVVIDANLDRARRLGIAGIPVVWGDAANAEVLVSAGVERARLLIVASPDESTGLLAVGNAARLNPGLRTIVRARHADEIPAFRALGAAEIIVPEYEGGMELMRQALIALGMDVEDVLGYSAAVRDISYGGSSASQGIA